MTVPVLDACQQEQLPSWLASVAQTFAAISREQAALMDRLLSIAAMRSLDEPSIDDSLPEERPAQAGRTRKSRYKEHYDGNAREILDSPVLRHGR